jgi:hypothetical protein
VDLVLTKLTNFSLETSQLLSAWKQAKVPAIHKKKQQKKQTMQTILFVFLASYKTCEPEPA